MTYRTLGDLLSELSARIGMGGMGASGGANSTLLKSFLRNGQMQLYRAANWRHLTDYKDQTTGVSQNLYDYPATGTMNTAVGCSRDKRVLTVQTVISGQYIDLGEGITTQMWSTMSTAGNPQRYERFKQLLVYPIGLNATDTLRVWFISDLGRFTVDADVATLDDEMILLHATANAKAHYRQPDAKLYEGQLTELMASLRGQSFGSGGVYRRGSAQPVERRPALLGRDA